MANRGKIEDDPKQFKELIDQLRSKMIKECKPLPNEPDFFTSEATLIDYLRARKYDLHAAFKMLKATVEWRRTYKPLERQIGHDKTGRPALYACFAQASTSKNTGEDTIAHCVQMLENTQKTLKGSATTWVFVFDCTGMTLPCCNPKLGQQVMHVFANYYPERLGQAIIINHAKVFHSIWKGIRKFLDPVTANKMVLLKKDQISEGLKERFDEDTAKWLEVEIECNREITEEQMRFWEKPERSSHDPRGSPAYVREYIATYTPTSAYQPHPNIIDLQTGKLAQKIAIQKVNHKAEKIDPKEYGIEDDQSGSSDIEIF
ncbi:unnamed protein product [Schistocephalus solidus]|uniref:Random slug protein 5 n=1 Tax=Schistocephalus solidus TaxID=70667 RepID=A0A183SVF1_SCHSO|nr:unnamed protein product [Schistocephalus solidus]